MAECIKCKKSYDYGKKFCITCGAKLIESKDILEEAKKLFDNKNYDKSLLLLDEIPSFTFFKDSADFLRLKIFYKTGNFEETERLIIEKDFTNLNNEDKLEVSNLILDLINDFIKKGELEKWKHLLQKAEELAPELSEQKFGKIYFTIGKAYFDKNDTDSAIEPLLKGKELGNEDSKVLLAKIYYNHSQKHYNSGSTAVAFDLIKKASVLQPEEELYLSFFKKLEKIQKEKKKKEKILIFSILSIVILAILIPIIYNNFFVGELEIIINDPSLVSKKIPFKIFFDDKLTEIKFHKVPFKGYNVNYKNWDVLKGKVNKIIGNYKIIIEAEYYKPDTSLFTIQKGFNQILINHLTPKISKVSANSNLSNSYLFIDDNFIGKTPISNYNLAYGYHTFKFLHQDYKTEIFSKEIKNENVDVDIKFTTSRVLLNENFSKQPKGWEDFHRPEYINGVFNGEYQLKSTSDQYFSIAYYGKTFKNFELITKMRAINPRKNYSFGGIQFCGNRNSVWDESYFIELSGSYLRVGYNYLEYDRRETNYLTNNWEKMNNLSTYFYNGFTLRLLCAYGKISVFVNNKLQFEKKDNTYSNGIIALLCSPYSDVRFDYVKVLEYDKDFYKYLKNGHTKKIKTQVSTLPHNFQNTNEIYTYKIANTTMKIDFKEGKVFYKRGTGYTIIKLNTELSEMSKYAFVYEEFNKYGKLLGYFYFDIDKTEGIFVRNKDNKSIKFFRM